MNVIAFELMTNPIVEYFGNITDTIIRVFL